MVRLSNRGGRCPGGIYPGWQKSVQGEGVTGLNTR